MLEKNAMLSRVIAFLGDWPIRDAGKFLLAAFVAGAVALPYVAQGQYVEASGGHVTSYVDDSGAAWHAHIFTEDGTLVVSQGGEVEVLVVGGGGGGGGSYLRSGDGGGGGGEVALETLTISQGNITVQVGEGGLGGTGQNPDANDRSGGSSSFGDVTALGGGFGATRDGGTDGGDGGSGGGGYGGSDSTSAGGNAVGEHLGFAGGSGNETDTYNRNGGGGGGAGQAGSDGASGQGGDGGDGIDLSDWLGGLALGDNGWFGGGGGGGAQDGSAGAGGLGGGGAGHATRNSPSVAEDGMASTGGGGGGAGGDHESNSSEGGAGGSGIVVVRYQAPPLSWGRLEGGIVTNYVDDAGISWMAHIFTASDTVTVESEGLIEYLIVGGGGGGASVNAWSAGGGGGGAVIEGTSTLSVGTHHVAVGVGGTGETPEDNDAGRATAGQESSFFGVTANGGVAGDRADNSTMLGGPGAGGASSDENGGPGIVSDFTGAAVAYGGGGGTARNGGAAGIGTDGGGDARTNGDPGLPGMANRGGGGGGGRPDFPGGGDGGSGIVVLRYQVTGGTMMMVF